MQTLLFYYDKYSNKYYYWIDLKLGYFRDTKEKRREVYLALKERRQK